MIKKINGHSSLVVSILKLTVNVFCTRLHSSRQLCFIYVVFITLIFLVLEIKPMSHVHRACFYLEGERVERKFDPDLAVLKAKS